MKKRPPKRELWDLTTKNFRFHEKSRAKQTRWGTWRNSKGMGNRENERKKGGKNGTRRRRKREGEEPRMRDEEGERKADRESTLWPWSCALALRPFSNHQSPPLLPQLFPLSHRCSSSLSHPCRGTLERDPPSHAHHHPSLLSTRSLLGRCKSATPSINITLSSSAARLVWAATERYHIKPRGALWLRAKTGLDRSLLAPTNFSVWHRVSR